MRNPTPIHASTRIALWFASLLLAVVLFRFFFVGPGSFVFIVAVTLVFAFPVACIYLPIVLLLKDAEGSRLWTTLLSGLLIGPTCMALWGIFLQLRSGDPHTTWHGDGLGLGGLQAMQCAAIVGSLTTATYVLFIRLISRLLARNLPHPPHPTPTTTP